MKAPTPLSNTDFSFMLEGITKDEHRAPWIGFKVGDKYPGIASKWLGDNASSWGQSLMGFPTLFHMLAQIDKVATHPKDEKCSVTMGIERRAQGGKEVPTGYALIASRRKDGLVSLRVTGPGIRDAIFPIRFGKGVKTEFRTESGEPIDQRQAHIEEALEWTKMMYDAAKHWKNTITDKGDEEQKEAMRERHRGTSSWG